MKKLFALLAILALALGLACAAQAEGGTYALGDRMDDFTVTLADGTEVSLYGLLAEKDAVLVNFWASWCPPCINEFPYMQEAYAHMSDEIGLISLSIEPTDTDEVIRSFQNAHDLGALPMGADTLGLYDRFGYNVIPVSAMVDRNGVICFLESGAIDGTGKFERLFKAFTGENYGEPKILDGIPNASYDLPWPDPGELAAALGIDEARIQLAELEDDSLWPFLPADDCVEISNGAEPDTVAGIGLRVDAAEDEALAFEYAGSCPLVYEGLSVEVDGETALLLGSDRDWTEAAVPLEAGVHQVNLFFSHTSPFGGDAAMKLRNLRLSPAGEFAQAAVKTLEGDAIAMEVADGDLRPIWVEGGVEMPWDAYVAHGDAFTLRFRVGEDVNENLLFYLFDAEIGALTDLERDESGYLLPVTAPEDKFAISSAAVIRNALYSREPLEIVDEWGIFWSEDTVNAALGSIASWGYAGGTAYRVIVTDVEGNPVEGAMVQFCDDGTCQVVFSGPDGAAELALEPFAYEIHIPMADGFATSNDVLAVMPESGGEITLVLERE